MNRTIFFDNNHHEINSPFNTLCKHQDLDSTIGPHIPDQEEVIQKEFDSWSYYTPIEKTFAITPLKTEKEMEIPVIKTSESKQTLSLLCWKEEEFSVDNNVVQEAEEDWSQNNNLGLNLVWNIFKQSPKSKRKVFDFLETGSNLKK